MYHFNTDEEYEIIKKIVIYYSIDRHDDLSLEIEARQKQYEYYRDKLLTFKKKEATEK